MWLVAGLGNPGRTYAKTRHNVGFLVLDELSRRLGLAFQEKTDSLVCRGVIGSEAVILLKPQTFMNRSGAAVVKAAKRYAVPPERILVVSDDLDLSAGRIRIRKQGSSGGHRGIASVIEQLGSRKFSRVRIGIGRDLQTPSEVYVLRKFTKDESAVIAAAVEHAADAIETVVTLGLDTAMNRYNRA